MALLSNPARRNDLFAPENQFIGSRRSDEADFPPYNNYARRINQFERNFKRNIGLSAHNIRRMASSGVANSVKRLGLLGKVTSRMARRGFGERLHEIFPISLKIKNSDEAKYLISVLLHG